MKGENSPRPSNALQKIISKFGKANKYVSRDEKSS
jgi:hypothetical protein